MILDDVCVKMSSRDSMLFVEGYRYFIHKIEDIEKTVQWRKWSEVVEHKTKMLMIAVEK